MSLPKLLKEAKNNQKGQILIIFLLVLVVGLAITLSIASRTITDVRQTTTSDESNRAYFAAEAGVEKALKKISDDPAAALTQCVTTNPANPCNADLNTVNNSAAKVIVSSLSATGSRVFAYSGTVAKDDVVQVSLINNFLDINTAGNTGLTPPSFADNESLDIFWGSGSGAGNDNDPALEFILVTVDNGGPLAWNLKKWVVDPYDTRANLNGFCKTGDSGTTINPPSVLTNTDATITYKFKVTINFATAFSSCNTDANSTGNHPVLARIKMLYNPGQVGIHRTNNTPLPDQGQKVESTGSTSSGVARKLTVDRLYSTLPSIFDYSLFNGSTVNSLTK